MLTVNLIRQPRIPGVDNAPGQGVAAVRSKPRFLHFIVIHTVLYFFYGYYMLELFLCIYKSC